MSAPMDPAAAAAMAAAIAAARDEIAKVGAINQKYFAAIMAVTVWDWIVQLDSEWWHIWKAKNTFLKFSYIFCRYWNFGVCILCLLAFNAEWTQSSCDRIVTVQAAVSVVTVCSASLLLGIRARAVWNGSWLVTGVLGFIFVAEFAVMMVVGNLWGESVPILNESGKGNCFPTSSHSGFIVYWIAPVIFDAAATIFMFAKAWETYRLGSPIAKVFLRDGLVYFLIISGFNILNVAFYAQQDSAFQGINSALALSASSVLACRLTLALKRHAASPKLHSLVTSNTTHKLTSTSAPTYLSFTKTSDRQVESFEKPEQTVEDLRYVSVQ